MTEQLPAGRVEPANLTKNMVELRVDQRAGGPKRIRPPLGVLFAFPTLLTVLLMGSSLFDYQDHLNKAWAEASRDVDSTPSIPTAAGGQAS